MDALCAQAPASLIDEIEELPGPLPHPRHVCRVPTHSANHLHSPERAPHSGICNRGAQRSRGNNRAP